MTSPAHPHVLTWSEMMGLVDADELTADDINSLIHTCAQLMADNHRLTHHADHVARALSDAKLWNDGRANHETNTCPLMSDQP